MYFTGFADEAAPGIDDQIAVTKELGWSNIESRNIDGVNIHDLSDEAFDEVAAKLAAYAGLAPRVRQSGRSLNSVTKPRAGNKRLKRAWVLSAARSIDFCEESRAYYDRKRAEGRCHYSAVIALARRRINVAYAMLRDGQRFESRLG